MIVSIFSHFTTITYDITIILMVWKAYIRDITDITNIFVTDITNIFVER